MGQGAEALITLSPRTLVLVASDFSRGQGGVHGSEGLVGP